MKVLLTGAKGQLGQTLSAKLNKIADIELIALDRHSLDIADQDAIKAQFSHYKPDWCINAAAYVKTDKAEENPDICYAINSEGVRTFAEYSKAIGAKLFHISTDYVFDGSKGHPYTEDDQTMPINHYGVSKRKGELHIQATLAEYIILRTSWVFGEKGNNFVKAIIKLAQEEPLVRIVNDQHGCPTPVDQLADAIITMMQNPHYGIYHFSGQPATTWYEFACMIFNLAKQHTTFNIKTIEPIASGDWRASARRPLDSRLDTSKIQRDYGIQAPNWIAALESLIPKLMAKEPITEN